MLSYVNRWKIDVHTEILRITDVFILLQLMKGTLTVPALQLRWTGLSETYACLHYGGKPATQLTSI